MAASETEYQPYDDRTQVARYIDRYPLSFKRTPLAPLVPRPLTLSERTGPVGLEVPVPSAGVMDLSRTATGAPRATGQLIQISGRVTDEDGSPHSGRGARDLASELGRQIHP